jgi:hypothetical protein
MLLDLESNAVRILKPTFIRTANVTGTAGEGRILLGSVRPLGVNEISLPAGKLRSRSTSLAGEVAWTDAGEPVVWNEGGFRTAYLIRDGRVLQASARMRHPNVEVAIDSHAYYAGGGRDEAYFVSWTPVARPERQVLALWRADFGTHVAALVTSYDWPPGTVPSGRGIGNVFRRWGFPIPGPGGSAIFRDLSTSKVTLRAKLPGYHLTRYMPDGESYLAFRSKPGSTTTREIVWGRIGGTESAVYTTETPNAQPSPVARLADGSIVFSNASGPNGPSHFYRYYTDGRLVSLGTQPGTMIARFLGTF